MKLTKFTFYKNTPFTDFQNTILFGSHAERESFFSKSYSSVSFADERFNFIRDRQTIDVNIPYDDCRGINYCSFLSQFEPIRYYAFVINYEYINDETTRFNILVDGIMTFCQGEVINTFKNLTVERAHLPLNEYKERAKEFQNNSDILKTSTKNYTKEYSFKFDEFDIIIQSSCDFSTDFGTQKNPLVETSEGLEFDKMTSPVNLYTVKKEHFRGLMKALSPYPWITQNIRSVSMIPSSLILGKRKRVGMETTDFKELYELKDKDGTNKLKLNLDLITFSKGTKTLYEYFGLDFETEKHLFRNEYTTTEVYTYDGQQLFIDNGQLNENEGLAFRAVYVSGFHTEIGVYISGYKKFGEIKDMKEGSFLNDSIYFRNFDEIPILIDNFDLAMAKSANRTNLAESKLITNKIGSIVDSGENLQDRFYNAASIASNFSPVALFGKFNDEHEYYKETMAEMADLALETPSISNQTHSNSLSISEDYYGLHVKHAQPIKREWNKIRKYYGGFGFLLQDENRSLNVHTHTICNYVKFKGSIMIPNCDVFIVEMIKAQFENGIRLWHNNGDPYPFYQDLSKNTFR